MTPPSGPGIGKSRFYSQLQEMEGERHGTCLSRCQVERDERLVFSLSVCGQRVNRSSPLRIFKGREVNR